jgi:DNA-binding Lrp family transcriptional regulator
MSGLDYFGPLPAFAYVLRETGVFTCRETDLLGLLMNLSVKNPVVFARQEELARILRCSVKTIQRSLRILESTGFLRRLYERIEKGYLRGKGYDMALTVAMMPSGKATKSPPSKATLASDGRNAAAQRKTPQKPAVQSDTGVRIESDSKDCRKKQTNPPASPPPRETRSPVVVALLDSLNQEGISTHEALQFVDKYGEARVQTVLKAFGERNARKKVRDPAGWIVDALTKGWNFPALTLAPSNERASGEGKPAVYKPFETKGIIGLQALENARQKPEFAVFQRWRNRHSFRPGHSEAAP